MSTPPSCGPCPGQIGKKRKATSELSMNPHTKKARDRKAGLSEVRQQVENAHAADRQAIRRAIEKLKKTAEYTSEPLDKKKALEQAAVKKTMENRHRQKKTAAQLEENLGYGESALAVDFDDGNANWDDIKEDNMEVLEKRHCYDDIQSFGEKTLPSDAVSNDAYKLLQYEIQRHAELSAKDYDWRCWSDHWKHFVKVFKKKLVYLNTWPIEQPIWKYFDKMDLAVFRTLQHTPKFCDKDGWIHLPGPVKAWRGIDVKKVNWDMALESDLLISYRLDALRMIYAKEMPKGFRDLSYSTQELMIFKPVEIPYF